ncbi:putative kelch-like protein 14 [Monocercomonoides exilis]|uniref:putative kelch-like protein 14 n=1 Tax=Monocercomonoides exilis TaxID=2049356 RepID=UPI0035598FD4|nr:putative kelch-like protein 14 [Monocercomonoides exilis]
MILSHFVIYILFFIFVVQSSVVSTNLCETYSKSPDRGIGPSPRESLAMVTVYSSEHSSTMIYFIGGIGPSGEYTTNIFTYNTKTRDFNPVETNSLLVTPNRKNFVYFVDGTNFYLWGGQGPNGLSNDMFVFNCLENTWKEIAQVNPPTPRQGSHFALFGRSFYIFGGRDFNEKKNDIWCWDLDTKAWREIAYTSNADTPEGRSGGSMYASANCLYIFGGMTTTGKYSQEIYQFDLTSSSWATCATEDSSGAEVVITKRIESSTAIFDQKVYMFGGFDDETQTCSLGDFVILDFSSADSAQKVIANVIDIDNYELRRRKCGLLVMNNELDPTKIQAFIFGGDKEGTTLGDMIQVDFTVTSLGNSEASANSDSSNKKEFLQDLARSISFESGHRRIRSDQTPSPYSYRKRFVSKVHNGLQLQFNVIAQNMPTVPQPRSHHRALTVENQMWIFGGIGEGGLMLNDLHSYNFRTKTWTEAETLKGTTEAPYLSDYCFCEHAGRLFFYGGNGKDPETGIVEPRNDLWAYSTLTHMWRIIEPLDSYRCPAVTNGLGIVLHKCIFIIGGYVGTEPSNQIWRFSLVTQKWMRIRTMYLPKAKFDMENNPPVFERPSFTNDGSEEDTETLNKRKIESFIRKINKQIEKEGNDNLTYFDFDASNSDINTQNSIENDSLKPFPDVDSVNRAKLNNVQRQKALMGEIPNAVQYELEPRGAPFVFPTTRSVGGGDDKWDFLLIGGGISAFKQSITTIDQVLIDFDLDDASYYRDTENFTRPYAYFSDPIDLGLQPGEPAPIFHQSYTIPTDKGFVSYGGLDVDYPQSYLTYVDLSNVSAPVVMNQVDLNSQPFLKMAGGAAVFFGRTMYTFGGMIIGKNIPTEQQPHNQMVIIEMKGMINCSPGTYNEDPADSSSACVPCLIGSFTKKWKTKECTLCRAGSVAEWEGASSPYHCKSCPSGYYNNREGSGSCTPCSESSLFLNSPLSYSESLNETKQISLLDAFNGYSTNTSSANSNNTGIHKSSDEAKNYCPVGSTTNLAAFPPSASPEYQPPFYQTMDAISDILMIACYFGGIALGLILGTLACICPTKKYIYFIDAFSESNPEKHDPVTHKAPKILRKSKVGAFVTITFVTFLVCAVACIIVEFAINNTTETKTLISSAMYPQSKLSQATIDNIEFLITFRDMHATCVEGEKDVTKETGWGTCAKTLQINTQNFVNVKGGEPFDIKCHQSPSNNIFHNTVANCDVRLVAGLSKMIFSDDISPKISIQSTEEEAHAFAVYTSMKVDTGIQFKNKTERLSFHSLLAQTETGDAIKGKTPLKFMFSLIHSLFVDDEDNEFNGMQIVKSSYTLGSTATNDDMFVDYGLMMEVDFEKDIDLLQTSWLARDKWFTFFANMLSTLMGFMGIFSICVWFVQKFMTFDTKLSVKMRRYLWGEADDGQPLLAQEKKHPVENKEADLPVAGNSDQDELYGEKSVRLPPPI